MTLCFWCQKTLCKQNKTKEHIIPKCLKGKDEKSNIEYACKECNNERAKLTTEWCLHQDVKNNKFKKKKGTLLRLKKKLNSRRSEILSLQSKWKKLELGLLGHSPSSEMNFDLWKIY